MIRMLLKLKSLAILYVTFMLFSCSNFNANQHKKDFLAYHKTNHQSNIFLTGIAFSEDSMSQRASLAAQLMDEDGNVMRGTIEINGEKFPFDTSFGSIHTKHPYTIKVFGRPNTIKVFDERNNLLMQEELVLPDYVHLAYENDSITIGSTIKWNKDTTNQKGLLLMVSFNPASPENYGKEFENSSIVTNYSHIIEDNGSYA